MKAEYINPFVGAAFSVLEMVLGSTPVKGQLGIQQVTSTIHDVNVVIGVTGPVQGNIIYGMGLQTALSVASKMTMQDLKMLDALGKSALAELANMISGNALLTLSESGIVCDITPPSLVKGQKVEISLLALPSLVLPIETSCGELTIMLGLQAAK